MDGLSSEQVTEEELSILKFFRQSKATVMVGIQRVDGFDIATCVSKDVGDNLAVAMMLTEAVSKLVRQYCERTSH